MRSIRNYFHMIFQTASAFPGPKGSQIASHLPRHTGNGCNGFRVPVVYETPACSCPSDKPDWGGGKCSVSFCCLKTGFSLSTSWRISQYELNMLSLGLNRRNTGFPRLWSSARRHSHGTPPGRRHRAPEASLSCCSGCAALTSCPTHAWCRWAGLQGMRACWQAGTQGIDGWTAETHSGSQNPWAEQGAEPHSCLQTDSLN